MDCHTKRKLMSLTLVVLAAMALAVVAPLVQAQSGPPPVPVDPNGPYARFYYAGAAPAQDIVQYYPHEFTHAYANEAHNAAFPIADDAPEWMHKGVRWVFPEARAWPLNEEQPFDVKTYGEARGLTTITQYYGNALGVSVVDGIVYAESDDFFCYAINARTGKLIWRNSPIGNNLMGTPLVVGDIVYVTGGSVAFNFHNVQRYAENPESSIRGGSVNYNGPFALNRHTGELVWYFSTEGETMPTPAYDDGKLYITTGAGKAYAVDAKTGKEIWNTELGGMANMSCPAVYKGRVYVSMSVKAFLYCLDGKSGNIVWKGTIPDATNTGMGDVSPAVAEGVVVMDAVTSPKKENGKTTMNTVIRAYNADDGKVLWTDSMGRGPKPPAFKGGVPMIHDGVVYVGTPVNSIMRAYDLKTGKILWTWQIPAAGPAGAGRGAPTYYEGTLYVSTGPDVFALDPKTGKLLGQKHVGGRFGIVQPTIVGGTIYLGNSWDWVIALPVSDVNPNYGK